MAHSSLPVFSHPDFPQVLSAAIEQFVERIGVAPTGQLFPQCDYSSPVACSTDCHSQSCSDRATVHHLPTELDLCARHYRKLVGRG
jgi:hypothetical protein